MRVFTHAPAWLFFGLMMSGPGQAATITNAELPDSIQSCIAAFTCFVSNTSAYESEAASAFQITQIGNSGSENNWLVRYAVQSPASGGNLWMLSRSTYSASETDHPLTLYFDRTAPWVQDAFRLSGEVSITMTTAGLVAGSGYRTDGLDDNGNDYTSGNLSGDVRRGCLSIPCETHERLNLLQLEYEDLGSTIALTSFDASDTRGLLYTQSSSLNCYDDPNCIPTETQSLYVSAVPLPGGVLLFGSGILGLIGFTKNRMLLKHS